jgi:hypothetical protein
VVAQVAEQLVVHQTAELAAQEFFIFSIRMELL